ncbi:MAG: serine/threonine-protein kinase [Fuerstiella sp.]
MFCDGTRQGVANQKYCDRQQLSLAERLNLFGDVCTAVQHAHQKGIIHRDIKPNNVLVTSVDGRPQVKVIDFGVAKATNRRLTEQTFITSFLQVVGTPLYMSPEQANSTGQDIDTRTDVYSLGVLLYVLLTGCTPFDRRRMKQAAFEEVCRIIREEEPARPSLRLSSLDDTLPTVAAMRNIEPKRLAASLSGDLDWIVMKALEKDRDRRYASASAFADDIGRYLLDEPVEASPPSRTYRLRKYTRRNRKTILATAMVVLALLTGLGLHTRELEQLNFQLEESVKGLNLSLAEEDRLREIANQSEREARGLQYVSDMTLAGRAVRSGDSRLVSELLGRHVPKKGAADYRGIEWHVLHRRYSRSTSILATMGYPLYYLAFSPDGETMAVAGGADSVVLMDADTGEIHSTIVTGHGEVNGVEFSKDGSMLATAGDDGAVRIWYTRNGEPKWSAAGHDGESYVAQILQDESVVVSCGTDSVLRMWDAETGTPAGEYEYHSNTIESFVVSPDETLLHSIGADDMSLLFDIRQRAPIAGSRIQHAKHPTGVAFAPDGGFFAICGVDRMIRLVDTRTHRFKNSTAREPLQSIALSPDGRLLATGGRGGSIDVWSVTHPEPDASADSLGARVTGDFICRRRWLRQGPDLQSHKDSARLFLPGLLPIFVDTENPAENGELVVRISAAWRLRGWKIARC